METNFKIYEALVLSGGGAKGLSYWALIEFIRRHYRLEKIKFFAGSSIGAFFSLLFALELEVDVVNDFIEATDFTKLVNISNWWLMNIFWAWWSKGIDNESELEKLIAKILSLRFDKDPKSITFEDIKIATGNELLVTTTNLNTRQTCYFSTRETPKESVMIAVKMSMAYPIVFKPILFGKDWMCDGGLSTNFPMKKVLEFFPQDKVLGCKLLTNEETSKSDNTIYCARKEIKSEIDFIVAAIESMEVARENQDLSHGFWNHVIPFQVGSHSLFQTNLSLDEKKKIKTSAQRDIENFLLNK